MADLRNQGFGLNYNRGFNNGAVFMGGGSDPNAQYAAQGYQQRQTQQKQQSFDNSQLQQQLGFSREQLGAETAGRQQALNSQQRIAQINADASRYPADLQQSRFNAVFPFLSQQLGGGGGDGSSGYKGQGQVGNQPTISAAPVYSENQIQQQVNSSRAANDQQTAGAQRQMQQQMSARGYGSNSPLAQELGVGLQNKNLSANTDAERQLRFDAAGANSKQVLAGQQAQEGQFANRQQEDIERNKVYQSKFNALIAAMGGLV